MKSQELKKTTTNASTQEYLDIAEIRENVVIMKDGTLRVVLLASSINFALKSEEEQTAVVQGYVGFLNSLDFPLQILVQSRPLNIDKYMADLEVLKKQQTNELLKRQTADYIEYIKEFLEIGDIMSKKFYVIVPYAPGKVGTKTFMERVSSIFSVGSRVKISRKRFDKYKEMVFKRVNTVISGLGGFGVTSVPLDTQSLIELYYVSYNPDMINQQKIKNINEYQLSTDSSIDSTMN